MEEHFTIDLWKYLFEFVGSKRRRFLLANRNLQGLLRSHLTTRLVIPAIDPYYLQSILEPENYQNEKEISEENRNHEPLKAKIGSNFEEDVSRKTSQREKDIHEENANQKPFQVNFEDNFVESPTPSDENSDLVHIEPDTPNPLSRFFNEDLGVTDLHFNGLRQPIDPFLSVIPQLPKLRHLHFHECFIKPKQLTFLQRLTNLQTFECNNSSVYKPLLYKYNLPKITKQIAFCSGLTSLSLNMVGDLSPDAISQLRTLVHLQILRLETISTQDFSFITSFPKLTNLGLLCRIKTKQIDFLSTLTKLRSLTLHTPKSKKFEDILRELTSLNVLYLLKPPAVKKLKDNGIDLSPAISTLTKLRSLRLNSLNSNENYSCLSTLTDITDLDINIPDGNLNSLTALSNLNYFRFRCQLFGEPTSEVPQFFFPNLRSLQVADLRFARGGEYFQRLCGLTTLTELTFEFCSFQLAEPGQYLSSLKQLRKLRMIGCWTPHNIAFPSFHFISMLTNLKELDLPDRTDQEQLKTIYSQTTNLRRISWNEPQDHEFLEIISRMKKLKSLKLSTIHFPFSDEYLQFFTSLLKLEDLSLSIHNPVVGVGDTRERRAPMFFGFGLSNLVHLNSLTRLVVSCADLKYEAVEQVSRITSLRTIEMSIPMGIEVFTSCPRAMHVKIAGMADRMWPLQTGIHIHGY